MKDKAYEILGKTISSVHIRYSKDKSVRPQSQLYLIFDDNTCFEFYCYEDDIRPTNGNWPDAKKHMQSYMRAAYFDAYKAEIDQQSGKVTFESRERG